eukprot:g2654.t1
MCSIEAKLEHFKARQELLLEESTGLCAAPSTQRCLALEKKCLSAEARAGLQSKVIDDCSYILALPTAKRALLPSDAKGALQEWFDDHADHPFPTDAQKLQLAQQCGITKEQVSVWFGNRRARLKGAKET